MDRYRLLALAALLAAAGCDASSATPPGDGAPGDGRASDAATGDGPGGGDGTTGGDGPGGGDGMTAGDGAGGGTPLSQCRKQNPGITLTCAKADSFEFMVAGKKFRCLGAQAFSKPKVRFRFKLSEVVGGDPRIRVIRIAERDTPHPTDMLLEWTAPAPAPLSTLPQKLKWEAFIKPMTLAGGLTFVDARIKDAVFQFSAPYDKQKLTGGTPVKGNFTVKGGTFTVLDKQGKKQTVQDPDAEGLGCFNLTGKLEAIL
jgi:hypothetical protein